MKKLLAVLLLCSLLLQLLLPCAFAAETSEDIPLDVLQRALEYAQENPDDSLQMQTIMPETQSMPEKRLAPDDNLIIPSPLLQDSATTPGSTLGVKAILVQTGKAEQYYCTAIYRGNNLQNRPIATKIGAFGTTACLREFTQQWHTKSEEIGTYTVLLFTGQNVNGNLVAVEGSASAVEVRIMAYVPSTQKLSFSDWETGETLETVTMCAGDSAFLAIKRCPVPSYSGGDISISASGPFRVEEFHGLLIVQSTGYGWGTLYVQNQSYVSAEIELAACIDPKGHHENTPIVVREPSAEYPGLALHTCNLCGAIKREGLHSYSYYFSFFVDVPKTEWYYDPVRSAVLKNLFRGVSTHHFDPAGKMTRAMLVTVLWRYEGSPAISGCPFTDVKPDVWYAQPVAWAAQNGIVDGVGKGKFDPEGVVTREQMAAILYRYAQIKALDTSGRGDLSGFFDKNKLSAWAADAVSWTVANGIIGGSKEGGKLLLNPKGGATRAEVAAILVRFIDNLADPIPPVETVDTTGAEASGSFNKPNISADIQWAFFPDGTLVIGGTGTVPSAQQTGTDELWSAYASRIKTIRVLYGIQWIGDDCFRDDYTALEKVELADSVTSIGDSAFKNCTSLKDIRLSETLWAIGREAFANCVGLTDMILPDSIAYLKYRAFYGCSGLTRMELPDSLIRPVSSIEEALGSEVFMNCTALEYVKLPLAQERIPLGFFYGCKSLKMVEIPFVTYSIRHGAFYGCEAFEEVVLPKSISIIEPMVFNACTNLKKITVLNPELTYAWSNDYEDEYYKGGEWPLGDPAQVTVCGYAGSTAQEIAEEYGYSFETICE